MSLTAKQGSNLNLPPVEAGTHPAVCYGVIDLGTQRTEYMGEPKDTQQVLILWELP